MPYTGSDDPKLPANVAGMAAAQKKKWVGVFNSTFNNCRSGNIGGKPGSEKDCEGVAAKFANGAVKEAELQGLLVHLEARLDGLAEGSADRAGLELAIKEVRQKCNECGGPSPAPVHEGELPAPLGGAISFDEVDGWREAMRLDDNIWMQKAAFDAIYKNIWDTEEISIDQKVAAVQQAAAELGRRVTTPPPAAKSLLETAKELLFGGKAAEEKLESGVSYRAIDFADVPDASKPSTWKLRLSEERSGNFTVDQVARAITAMQPGGFRGNRVQMGSDKSSVVSRISGAINKIPGASDDQKKSLRERLEKVKEIELDEDNFFSVTKEVGGQWRWLAVHSNKFRDLEQEIFRDEAHKEYEAWVDASGQYPELRLWHVPGSRAGQADFVAYDGGFIISSGVFDPGQEGTAQSLARAASKGLLACSHGYRYLDSWLKDGVYEKYRTFEITVLPRERPANVWTDFYTVEQMLKEVKMGLSDQKKAFLVEHMGQERADRVEDTLGRLTKELEGSGVGWKELNEAVAAGGDGEDGPNPTPPAPNPPSPPNPTPPAPNPPPPPTGEEPKPTPPPAEEALVTAVREAVQQAIAPYAASITSLKEAVKELQLTDDEKIAQVNRPRTQVGAAAGQRPSDATSTLLEKKEQEKAAAELKLGTEDGDEPEGVAAYVHDFLTGGRRPQQSP